jgi:hypothetical protein
VVREGVAVTGFCFGSVVLCVKFVMGRGQLRTTGYPGTGADKGQDMHNAFEFVLLCMPLMAF